MRLQYFLLVAATTILASVAAVAAGTSSAQTMISTTTSANRVPPVRLLRGAEANDGNAKMFLRRSYEDQEERAILEVLTKWIKGIKERRARRAELKRSQHPIHDYFVAGMLDPPLLKGLKDEGIIDFKIFNKYMTKLNAQ